MLQLTKRTEYGLIALVAMAGRPGEFVSVREISEQYGVPKRLLAEVLKQLSHHDVVDSQRGASGGYALSRPAEQVNVGEVVTVLEGAPALSSCEVLDIVRGSDCDLEHSCPIRSPLQTIRQGLWRLLERTTLDDLRQPYPLGTAATETLLS